MTKKKLRNVYRKCRDKENVAIAQRIPTAVVCEDESIRSYNRKRLIQNYETPPAKRRATNKSHSPDFENVIWNKDEVLEALEAIQQDPLAPPSINWQLFAKSHNIPGGQVAKEFAKKSGRWSTTPKNAKKEAPRRRNFSTYLTYSNHSPKILEGHGRQRPIVSWCTLLSFPLCC